MPEARFPDEKFWSKDGDPIQAAPKGPPKGSGHTSMKSLGAGEPEDPASKVTPKNADLRDHFSKTFPEYLSAVDGAAKRAYGPDYMKKIEEAFNKPGMIRDALKQMWDVNYTDHEAFGEIGFLFDTAQQAGQTTYNGHAGGPAGYPRLLKPDYWANDIDSKGIYDPTTGDVTPRPGRPTGVKGGKLVF